MPSCRLLAAYYGLFGAAWCAYQFYLSTQPVTIPDDWGAQAPAWLSGIAYTADIFLLPLWLVAPIPLLIMGLAGLRRAAPGRWRWLAAWAGAVAAGVALEVLAVTQVGFRFPPTMGPNGPSVYTGPGIISWVALAESLGFVAVGTVMIGMLARAERAVSGQPAGSP